MTMDPLCEVDPPAPRSNPRWQTPNSPGAPEHPLADPACSLVESLGALVDDVRQLYTDVGLRPYRLWSIVTQWSGGEVGRGTEQIISEVELLPTPLVELGGLRSEVKPAGLQEQGSMRVTEISPRYTEDDIRALFFIQPLPPGHTGFVEMRVDARDGNPVRRRFVVSGVPERRASRFDWHAQMLEQNTPRSRAGVLQSRFGVVF